MIIMVMIMTMIRIRIMTMTMTMTKTTMIITIKKSLPKMHTAVLTRRFSQTRINRVVLVRKGAVLTRHILGKGP